MLCEFSYACDDDDGIRCTTPEERKEFSVGNAKDMLSGCCFLYQRQIHNEKIIFFGGKLKRERIESECEIK